MRGLLLLLVASTANADPRPGANHRLGDDSFVAAFGREPDGRDSERVRMKVHLQHVRALLGDRPATRPELAAKRAELLGYLDDYIAKGITPQNTTLPLRTPVFIDFAGNICAVGYLIERSVGRELAETIATHHRYDFLEDIAAARPDVRAWIDTSGLTLDELASIQPGYNEPAVESWRPLNVARWKVQDGQYKHEGSTGTLVRKRMTGEWRVTKGEAVVGEGTFSRGAGTWTSFYRTGVRMGRGPFARNVAHGAWTLWHPSGNVAARGRFTNGVRDGAWQFFYDTPAQTPIASGAFARGSIVGTWRHYDDAGKVFAVTAPAEGSQYEGATLMTVTPKAGIQHEVHRIGGVDGRKMHGYYKGRERLYFLDDEVWDADGNLLTRDGGTWFAADCKWSAKRKRAARNTDITSLHQMVRRDFDTCKGLTVIDAKRAPVIDELFAARQAVRMPSPAFVKRLVAARHERWGGDVTAIDDETASMMADLTRVLAENMAWYIEWPHIDGRFMELHATMAGYRYYENASDMFELPEESEQGSE